MSEQRSEKAEAPSPSPGRRAANALRKEAETLASDPIDLEEAHRVREDMDAAAAPWPDD